MLQIAILGCCCTGDIFHAAPEAFKIVRYFTGTTMLSLMSPPVAIDPAAVKIENRFEQRVVLQDFSKNFWGEIRAVPFDYLTVDWVNEGLDLIQIGNSLVTCSEMFTKAGLKAGEWSKYRRVSRFQPQMEQRWREAREAFSRRLLESVPARKIILHRVKWAERYRTGDQIYPFPPGLMKKIHHRNAMLSELYTYFSVVMPDAHVLDLSGAGYLADTGHPWGLAPYHFEAGYYRQAAAEICALTADKETNGEKIGQQG